MKNPHILLGGQLSPPSGPFRLNLVLKAIDLPETFFLSLYLSLRFFSLPAWVWVVEENQQRGSKLPGCWSFYVCTSPDEVFKSNLGDFHEFFLFLVLRLRPKQESKDIDEANEKCQRKCLAKLNKGDFSNWKLDKLLLIANVWARINQY